MFNIFSGYRTFPSSPSFRCSFPCGGVLFAWRIDADSLQRNSSLRAQQPRERHEASNLKVANQSGVVHQVGINGAL
jgi:hypothetical protein